MIDLAELPALIRDDDPRFTDAHDQRYEGKTYRLYWSDYPRKEEAPAVYLLSADKTSGSRVYDEALEAAVAEEWWQWAEYRIRNIGRDEVVFLSAAPPVTATPAGFMAKALWEQAGGKNPLLPDPPAPETWTCPKCGNTNHGGKFCPECGAKRP